MTTYILPYKMGSEGAERLSKKSGWKRIKLENSQYKHNYNNTIINWGSSTRPDHIPSDAMVINTFDAVSNTINKISALRILKRNGVTTVPFTTDFEQAKEWLEDWYKVVGRKQIKGYDGKGLVIFSTIEDLEKCQLYTKLVDCDKEFRVNVVNGKMISGAKKVFSKAAREEGKRPGNIRTGSNGYIFQYTNTYLPQAVCDLAIKAIKALRLDFGGVDIIFNSDTGDAYVLEVNTAPEIGPVTVDDFVFALSAYGV